MSAFPRGGSRRSEDVGRGVASFQADLMRPFATKRRRRGDFVHFAGYFSTSRTQERSEVNSNCQYRFVKQSDDSIRLSFATLRRNCKAPSPCCALLVRFAVCWERLGQTGLPLYWIAAAKSVAMSFIAREGKVSFECCRPYEPTRRLRSAIPTIRLGAANPTSFCGLIVQKSLPPI